MKMVSGTNKKTNMCKQITVEEICNRFGLTTFDGKEGNIIPLYNTWSPFLENKIRFILLSKGWSILYNPNNVAIRKGRHYYIGKDFIEALRKQLNGNSK